MKYHYIYRTTNIITQKYYIGIHTTSNLDDDYIGSGKILKRGIAKYGVAAYVKTILEYCPTREVLLKREQEILSQLLEDRLCINILPGGSGGFRLTSEQQKLNNKKSQEAQKILREDPAWVQHKSERLSQSQKELYKSGQRVPSPPDWTGRKHTEKTKQKISKAKTGKPNWNKGIPHKKSTKKDISNSLKAFYKTHPSSTLGRRWMYHPISNELKMINEDNIQQMLNIGWMIGRKTIDKGFQEV